MSPTRRLRPARNAAGPFLCPRCNETFVIGPDFVMDLVSTGRIRPDGRRAELRCRICEHTWWSKHPEAIRKARAERRI